MKIERKPSIENEPRTLSLHQIEHAREAALYVLKTKTMEEALGIFTEGLEPVVRAGQTEKKTMEYGEDCDYFASLLKLPPLFTGIRDVATAPF